MTDVRLTFEQELAMLDMAYKSDATMLQICSLLDRQVLRNLIHYARIGLRAEAKQS